MQKRSQVNASLDDGYTDMQAVRHNLMTAHWWAQSEFYTRQHLTQFDNFDDLISLLENADLELTSKRMLRQHRDWQNEARMFWTDVLSRVLNRQAQEPFVTGPTKSRNSAFRDHQQNCAKQQTVTPADLDEVLSSKVV